MIIPTRAGRCPRLTQCTCRNNLSGVFRARVRIRLECGLDREWPRRGGPAPSISMNGRRQWNVGGIHWVHGPQIIEFRDVVDTSRRRRQRGRRWVLLHTVTLLGQRFHVLGEGCRARFALLPQYRNIHRPCPRRSTSSTHVKHEVVGGRGVDHDGNGINLHRRRALCYRLFGLNTFLMAGSSRASRMKALVPSWTLTPVCDAHGAARGRSQQRGARPPARSGHPFPWVQCQEVGVGESLANRRGIRESRLRKNVGGKPSCPRQGMLLPYECVSQGRRSYRPRCLPIRSGSSRPGVPSGATSAGS